MTITIVCKKLGLKLSLLLFFLWKNKSLRSWFEFLIFDYERHCLEGVWKVSFINDDYNFVNQKVFFVKIMITIFIINISTRGTVNEPDIYTFH